MGLHGVFRCGRFRSLNRSLELGMPKAWDFQEDHFCFNRIAVSERLRRPGCFLFVWSQNDGVQVFQPLGELHEAAPSKTSSPEFA